MSYKRAIDHFNFRKGLQLGRLTKTAVKAFRRYAFMVRAWLKKILARVANRESFHGLRRCVHRITGLWDYGVTGLWDYGAMGLWGCGVTVCTGPRNGRDTHRC